MKVRANGLDIEVEDTGESGRPAVLLIMGLGMQLVAWPPRMVEALQAAGLRVIRFDNRDVGLSTWLDHLGVPNVAAASLRHRMGFAVHAPYTLADMALDAIGVLDALGLERAHVVGASLGGMVAQRVALAAPGRVVTLTSLMSTSGAPFLPGPRAAVLAGLLARPTGSDEEAVVAHFMRLLRLIGSPAFPTPEAEARERVRAMVRRAWHPEGTVRQLVAVGADTRRYLELPRIQAPTLVLHGTHDPLVPFACGHDTALRIPGARLVPINGMGHDLPPGVVDALLPPLLAHLR